MFGKIKVFLEQVNIELKKVTWPSREELKGSTIVVIVSTILLAIFIGIADYAISKLVNILIR